MQFSTLIGHVPVICVYTNHIATASISALWMPTEAIAFVEHECKVIAIGEAMQMATQAIAERFWRDSDYQLEHNRKLVDKTGADWAVVVLEATFKERFQNSLFGNCAASEQARSVSNDISNEIKFLKRKYPDFFGISQVD
jgi:hypothetical protein